MVLHVSIDPPLPKGEGVLQSCLSVCPSIAPFDLKIFHEVVLHNTSELPNWDAEDHSPLKHRPFFDTLTCDFAIDDKHKSVVYSVHSL